MRERLSDRLHEIDGMELFVSKDASNQAGVLSCRVRDINSEVLARLLGEAGVAVRAGYHCAPLAHESGATLDTGTLRFSFSPFNTPKEIDIASKMLLNCVKKL